MSRSRFSKVLDRAGRLRASTLFLHENEPSLLRVSGAVLPLPDDPDWTSAELSEVLRSLVQAGPRRTFEERGRVEFSYTDKRGGIWIGAALRLEAGLSLTFESFAPPAKQPVPSPFLEAASADLGWVWVVGKRGSGKTSILERCVRELAQKRSAHVLVLERGVSRIRTPTKGYPFLLEHQTYETNQEVADLLRNSDPDVAVVDDLDGGVAFMACAKLAARGRLVITAHRGGDVQQALVHAILSVDRADRRRFRELVARRFTAGLLQVLASRNTGIGKVACHELVMGGDAFSRFLRTQPFAPAAGGLPGRELELKDGLLNLVQRAIVHPATALATTPNEGSLRRAMAASGYDLDGAPPAPPTELPPELRREPRVAVPNGIANVSVLDQHGRCAHLLQGRVLDLSSTGLGLEVPRPLRRQVEVQVAFTLGDEQLEARGVVRSSRRKTGDTRWLAGVSLTFVPPSVRARIDEFVRLES